MSPSDFATPELEEQPQTATPTEQQPQQHAPYPQSSQPPQSSQQPQCFPYLAYTQSYESPYTSTVPYHDPLRSDLTPEAVSALNCYLQVSGDLSAYGGQMGRTEEDPM